jgi:cysteine desulfurase
VLAAITDETRLVTVTAACNETGVLQPVAAIASGARRRGVVMHTDAVQALPWLGLDVARLDVDLLSGSGHKLGAVGGIGLLVVRDGIQLEPIVIGGGQEGGRRASTENVAGAASLAAALERLPDGAERAAVAARRDALEQAIAALGDVEVIGQRSERLPNTSCLRLAGCAGDGLLMALDLEGIQISTGSACASGSIDPSPILLAIGLSREEAKETVRLSLTGATTDAAIETAAEAIVRLARRMRT